MTKKSAILIMIVLVAIDQVIKQWVKNNIGLYEITNLIPNFIDLTYVNNKGISFGLFSTLNDNLRLPFLIGLPLVVVLGITLYWYKQYEVLTKWMRLALLLIIPGAIGNLIDRTLYGQVIDFMQFRWFDTVFFINNFADDIISLGSVMLFVSMIFDKDPSAEK